MILYHGSNQQGLVHLLPGKMTFADEQSDKRVWATPDLGLAAIFAIRWSSRKGEAQFHEYKPGKCASLAGPESRKWHFMIYKPDCVKDTAGSVYTLGDTGDPESMGFVQNTQVNFPEFYSTKSWKVLHEERFESAFEYALQHQVYISYLPTGNTFDCRGRKPR